MEGTAPDLLRPQGWLRDSGCWVIISAGVALWLAGYPLPHVDDLFYSGAGIELAASGRLVNPWITPWLESFGGVEFLASPPVLPYTLAAWLRLFGTNTATLTAFYLAVSTGLAAAIYRLTRKSGLALSGALAVAAVVEMFTLVHGMRPEGLAFSLILMSQIYLNSPGRARCVLGALFGAGAVLTHPLAMSLVVPLHIWRTIRAWRTRREFSEFMLGTAVGLALAFAAFAVAVHGRISEFWHVQSVYSKLLTPPLRHAPAAFWGQLTLGKQPYLLAPFAAVIIGSAIRVFVVNRPSRDFDVLRSLWLVWLSAVMLGAFLYPTRMANLASYSGVVLSVASWKRSRWTTPIAFVAVTTAILHNAGSLLVPVFGGRERPDASSIKLALSRQSGKMVCLDEFAIRHVFDFRPPSGIIDWNQRQAAQFGVRGLLATKPKNEIWLVNEWKLEHWIPDSRVQAARLKIGRFTFGSIPAEPYRMKLLE